MLPPAATEQHVIDAIASAIKIETTSDEKFDRYGSRVVKFESFTECDVTIDYPPEGNEELPDEVFGTIRGEVNDVPFKAKLHRYLETMHSLRSATYWVVPAF